MTRTDNRVNWFVMGLVVVVLGVGLAFLVRLSFA
jgi:hypothetical protein